MAAAARRRVSFLVPALLLVACRSTLADFDDAAEEERQRASGMRSLERDGKGKVPDINAQFRGTERRPAGAAGSGDSTESIVAKEEAAIEEGGENREQGIMPYQASADSPYVDPDQVVPDAEPPSWIHEPTWWWLTPPWWIVTPPLWSEAARSPDASDQGVWMGEGARPSVDVSFLQLMSQIDSLGVLEMPQD